MPVEKSEEEEKNSAVVPGVRGEVEVVTVKGNKQRGGEYWRKTLALPAAGTGTESLQKVGRESIAIPAYQRGGKKDSPRDSVIQ